MISDRLTSIFDILTPLPANDLIYSLGDLRSLIVTIQLYDHQQLLDMLSAHANNIIFK